MRGKWSDLAKTAVYIKFRYCEKAPKCEKRQNKVGDFLKNFVAFSEYLNITDPKDCKGMAKSNEVTSNGGKLGNFKLPGP